MFNEVRKEMEAFYQERDDVIEGLLLGLISREHVLFVGKPGTAKSMMVRDLCSRIQGASYFEWLLTKFSTPEELFGPVSLKALENDEYRRITTGKLPEAEIVFLDEIFKASAGILNSLLSVVNERKFHNNSHPVSVPLQMMVGASTELPMEAELQALYDRLLLRYEVQPIQGLSAFGQMVRSKGEAEKTARIGLEELREAQKQVDETPAGGAVLSGLIDIRKKIQEVGLSVSDRRWKKSFRLARARAVLHDREETAIEDLIVLSNTLWDLPEQRRKVERIVATVANPLAAKALDYQDMIDEIRTNVLFNSDGTPNSSPDPAQGSEANAKLKVIGSEISDLLNQIKKDGGETAALEKALAAARRANRQVCETALGLDMSAVEV